MTNEKKQGIVNDCYNNNQGKCYYDNKPCTKPKGKECTQKQWEDPWQTETYPTY